MVKKIPMRQCLGCREMKPKRELLRVVRSPEGEVSLDTRGKKARAGGVCLPECGLPEKSGKDESAFPRARD